MTQTSKAGRSTSAKAQESEILKWKVVSDGCECLELTDSLRKKLVDFGCVWLQHARTNVHPEVRVAFIWSTNPTAIWNDDLCEIGLR